MTLILLGPFVAFAHVRHDILAPEVGLIALFMLLLGIALSLALGENRAVIRCIVYTILIVLFIDVHFELWNWWGKRVAFAFAAVFVATWILREHLQTTAVAIFGTINLATLGLVVFAAIPISPPERSSSAAGSQSARLPAIVHIVLDAQIGIAGIPSEVPGGDDLRRKLRAFLQENKFQVYGGAYSRHTATQVSLSTLMNYAPFEPSGDAYHEQQDTSRLWRMIANKYFESMYEMGYGIIVHQSTFLDYCSKSRVPISWCSTYEHYSISNVGLGTIDLWTSVSLIFRMFADNSFLFTQLRRQYLSAYDMLIGDEQPAHFWRDWSGWVGPIPSLAVLVKMSEDDRLGRKGTLYFAHILMPHGPYVYNKDCQVRVPFTAWKANKVETAAERSQHYELYFEQVECVFFQLGDIFTRLKEAGRFDDAIIIIHGDHGSRLYLQDASSSNRDDLPAQSNVDAYSTLFAIKSPELAPGYRPEVISVQEIFSVVMGAAERSDPSPDGQFVYRTRDGQPVRVPMSGLDGSAP